MGKKRDGLTVKILRELGVDESEVEGLSDVELVRLLERKLAEKERE